MYPKYDFSRLPVRPVAGATQRPVIIDVDMPGRRVFAKVWVAQVGRIPLLLLDTDIPQNDPADRPISGLLYVRGREMRLAQEVLLGVGGARALRELDLEPSVWHLNEGHSAFLQLERMVRMSEADHGPKPEHLEQIRATSVFTTHTPVPAGNEQFDPVLVRKYLHGWVDRHGLDVDKVIAMGKGEPEGSHQTSFNLTALAVRTSNRTNGVSKLHGHVSSEMWRHLYPDAADDEDPIGSITNGIHTQTWLGSEMLEVMNRHLGLNWMERVDFDADLDVVREIDDEEVWQAHQTQKERLARFVRVRMREQFARHGCSSDELREISEQFRPDRLTIGFARRFATYKRADLLFRDLHRVRALVADRDRPVQIVIAGKAHPADHPGQELIQHIYQLSQSSSLRGRIFFLEDYDMRVGRVLVQGVDVWLNTPRRPMEASGTSGQKAAANGSLNLSILDGWWPEAYNGENGFAIGEPRDYDDPEIHDREDALALYEVLEQEVVPTYYDRDDADIPRRWVEMMKNAIAYCLPHFSTGRMVRDYATKTYRPVIEAGEQRESTV
jgi:starch phosphorylase